MIVNIDLKCVFLEASKPYKEIEDLFRWCLSYDEIELRLMLETTSLEEGLSNELNSWLSDKFPELCGKVLIVEDLIQTEGDFFISSNPEVDNRDNGLFYFDYRNPIYTMKKLKEKISSQLKNSRKLTLHYNYGVGVWLLNATNTLIKRITILSEEITFFNIKPGESIVLYVPQIPEYEWIADIKEVEWDDGVTLKDFRISTDD